MADIKLCAFADEAGDSLADQIKAMQENGIGLLELRTIDKKNVTKFTNDEVKEYKKQLDDAGIKVWSIGSPIGKVQITADFNIDLDYKNDKRYKSNTNRRKLNIAACFTFPVCCIRCYVYGFYHKL